MFIFGKDGNDLMWNMRTDRDLMVYIGDNSIQDGLNGMERAIEFNLNQVKRLFDPNLKRTVEDDTCSLTDYFEKIIRLEVGWLDSPDISHRSLQRPQVEH